LFDPLEISSEPAAQPIATAVGHQAYDQVAGFGWSTDPQGLNLGFGDLKLTATDMTKLGQLYLDGGRWADRQLVPTDWVGSSTTAQVPEGEPAGYGYQWWISDPQGHPAFSARGLGGQLIEVVPDVRMVVVVSCQNGVGAFNPVSLSQLVDQIIDQAVVR
jgi:CubicO group peptidase (beta-lactamase class C family)